MRTFAVPEVSPNPAPAHPEMCVHVAEKQPRRANTCVSDSAAVYSVLGREYMFLKLLSDLILCLS